MLVFHWPQFAWLAMVVWSLLIGASKGPQEVAGRIIGAGVMGFILYSGGFFTGCV